MSTSDTFVIVGGGMAGAKAAETLREEGFDGRVVLLAEDDARPYERPPLSKDFLRGEPSRARSSSTTRATTTSTRIELRTGTRATAHRPGAAEVDARDGERMRLRRPAARDRLGRGGSRCRHRPRRRAVCCARSADCRAAGPGDPRRRPRRRDRRRLDRLGGRRVRAPARGRGHGRRPRGGPAASACSAREVGAIYRDLHADHTASSWCSAPASRRSRATAPRRGVRTTGGARLRPTSSSSAPAQRRASSSPRPAGLRVDDGVIVDDAALQRDADVFAAGDVARADAPAARHVDPHRALGQRIEQGPAAARNMLGARVAYDKVPYFFSDQYDARDGVRRPQARATTASCSAATPRAASSSPSGCARGRVLAGMNFNVWDVTDDIQALVRSRADVDVDRLRDPDTALADLIPAPEGERFRERVRDRPRWQGTARTALWSSPQVPTHKDGPSVHRSSQHRLAPRSRRPRHRRVRRGLRFREAPEERRRAPAAGRAGPPERRSRPSSRSRTARSRPRTPPRDPAGRERLAENATDTASEAIDSAKDDAGVPDAAKDAMTQAQAQLEQATP